jgi:hypothetical protein
MSLIYIYAIAIGATFVSVTGAFFSVTGLAQLFSGSFLPVIIMTSSLEFSKFIVVGFLYRYWGHIHKPLRMYLSFAVLTLMVITSIGIYGFLSNAYQVSSISLHTSLMQIESMERENDRVQKQIKEVQVFVDKIPENRLSKKFEFQKKYEPRLDELRTRSEFLVQQIDEKRLGLLQTQTKVGPIVYLARTLHIDVDVLVNWLIVFFVLVFDPLAVSLVFCLNLLVRLREKYRGNEYKIGAHSLTSPVDHRYSKPKKPKLVA